MKKIDGWLRTDTHNEAISALKMANKCLEFLNEDIYYWKYILLTIHESLQSFMVLALKGTNNLNVLTKKSKEEWIQAYEKRREGEEVSFPKERLDKFSDLFKKIQRKGMLYHVPGLKYSPTAAQKKSVKRLHVEFRNNFIHFTPKGWSIEVLGLPQICLDCLEVIYFLGWSSGSVFWYKEEVREAGEREFNKLKSNFEKLRQKYLKQETQS